MSILSISYQKFRLRSSYVSAVISISLVLFMIGVLGLLLLKSARITNYFKEKITITLFLKDGVKKDDLVKLRTSLLKKTYVKNINYITKQEAAKSYSKDIGQDFMTFLGTNPLKNAIDIYLNPNDITVKKLKSIKKEFQKNHLIFEVLYNELLTKILTKNFNLIGFWGLIISAFFLLIAVILINNSIRLSIYSKRFTIKTMQMVGATKRLIRRPFIRQSILLGLFSSLISICCLFAVIYYVNVYLPTLKLLEDYTLFVNLAVGILITAIIITWISSFLATQRFLNLKTDELY